MLVGNESRFNVLRVRPNPAVNADVPGAFVLLASCSGGAPVTLYR